MGNCICRPSATRRTSSGDIPMTPVGNPTGPSDQGSTPISPGRRAATEGASHPRAGSSPIAGPAGRVSLQSTLSGKLRPTTGRAGEIADRLLAHDFEHFMLSPRGQCETAAEAVSNALRAMGQPHGFRALLIWTGNSDNLPNNHVAVTTHRPMEKTSSSI